MESRRISTIVDKEHGESQMQNQDAAHGLDSQSGAHFWGELQDKIAIRKRSQHMQDLYLMVPNKILPQPHLQHLCNNGLIHFTINVTIRETV